MAGCLRQHRTHAWFPSRPRPAKIPGVLRSTLARSRSARGPPAWPRRRDACALGQVVAVAQQHDGRHQCGHRLHVLHGHVAAVRPAAHCVLHISPGRLPGMAAQTLLHQVPQLPPTCWWSCSWCRAGAHARHRQALPRSGAPPRAHCTRAQRCWPHGALNAGCRGTPGGMGVSGCSWRKASMGMTRFGSGWFTLNCELSYKVMHVAAGHA